MPWCEKGVDVTVAHFDVFAVAHLALLFKPKVHLREHGSI